MDIKEFLENKSIRETIIKKQAYSFETKLFKVNFDRFDYVYVIDYVENKKPRRCDNAEFGGIIDTETNKLYFVNYYLRNYCEDIKSISEEEINNQYNEMLKIAYENFADTVADDQIPTENEIACAKSDAESDYYYKRQRDKSLSYGISKSRDISELIKFVENPKQTVKDYIEMLEVKDKTLTNAIKYKKMMQRLENEFIEQIETSPEYKNLRLAKQINYSIPNDAKTVNIFYRLSNGEILEGKIVTTAFDCKPYHTGENMHFCSFSLNKDARDRLRHIDGFSRSDIYINNIEKLTYKGKTLYQKEDKKCL